MKKRFSISIMLVLICMFAFSCSSFAGQAPIGSIRADGAVNIRKYPSASSDRVGGMSKDNPVDYYAETTDYYQVKCAEGENGWGYVLKSVVQLAERYQVAGEVTITAATLNVRQSADDTAARIGSLTSGKQISYYGESNGYLKIWYEGSECWGYIKKAYTSLEPAADPGTETPTEPEQPIPDSAEHPASGGTVFKTSTGTVYRITKSGSTKGEVTLVKKTAGGVKAVVPATVTHEGISYLVTGVADEAMRGNKKVKELVIGTNVRTIGRNAFRGCSKLKSIQIKTVKLTKTSVKAGAFQGIYAYAKVKVPAKKLNAYRTILRAKGLGRTQTITK